ncbi:hypothetical protein UlMin_017622 [Ulmus minor]
MQVGSHAHIRGLERILVSLSLNNLLLPVSLYVYFTLDLSLYILVTLARETYEKDTISTASSIKRLASENVFVIQVEFESVTPRRDYYSLTPKGQEQNPLFRRKWITPREPPDRNVVLTVGALHQIDATSLRSAASAYHDEFAPLPKPVLVVNIGGPTRCFRYGADLAKYLVSNLHSVLVSCGSVRICFSNRTTEKVSSIIVKELGDNPKVFIWNCDETIPHMGHLAWADAFVVTSDSVGTISEVCSSGRPVYVMGSKYMKIVPHNYFHNLLSILVNIHIISYNPNNTVTKTESTLW